MNIILSHTHLIFTEKGTVHGVDLYYHAIERSVFSNMSEDPSNVGYYAFSFKYGMLNLSSNMPMGMCAVLNGICSYVCIH